MGSVLNISSDDESDSEEVAFTSPGNGGASLREEDPVTRTNRMASPVIPMSLNRNPFRKYFKTYVDTVYHNIAVCAICYDNYHHLPQEEWIHVNWEVKYGLKHSSDKLKKHIKARQLDIFNKEHSANHTEITFYKYQTTEK